MKLINKFMLGYIVITTIVLMIGGVILYKQILSELENEARNRLTAWINDTADLIEKGELVDSLANKNIVIELLPENAAIVPLHIQDSTGVFPPRRRGVDRMLTISTSRKIKGKHFLISASDFIAEQDEIFTGVRNSLVIVAGLLVVLVTLMSLFLSKRILSPFHHMIHAIKQFNLKQQTPILGRPTTTKEFKELNYFLENMSAKALYDYRVLKEFSENISHEIQTPLTIIRGKLELLMDKGVTEEQSHHINAIHNAVQKLSSVNHSLVLLTKLENLEFSSKEKINLSLLLENLFQSFQELMEMKSIVLKKEIRPDVEIPMSYPLAEILMNNLLGNAIRHNVINGQIEVKLFKNSMVLSNTGNPPTVNPEELFKRFKKGNQSSSSTGLGLSIVKQICDLADIKIRYQFEGGMHTVALTF